MHDPLEQIVLNAATALLQNGFDTMILPGQRVANSIRLSVNSRSAVPDRDE